MALHSSAFEYLRATETQLEQMADVRMAFKEFALNLESALPDGSPRR